jgi:hypothetical protein
MVGRGLFPANGFSVELLGVNFSVDIGDLESIYKSALQLSGNNSVVECDLAKVEVAGSNPVSRSIFFLAA